MNFFLETGKNRFFHFFPVPGFPGTGDFWEKIPVLEKNEKKKMHSYEWRRAKTGFEENLQCRDFFKNLGTGKIEKSWYWKKNGWTIFGSFFGFFSIVKVLFQNCPQ